MTLAPDWSELGLESEWALTPELPEDWVESGFDFAYMSIGWQDLALCAQVGGDAFFPDEGGGAAGQVEQAQRICAKCDVREQCLDWALANRERSGIWGGLTLAERRELVRARPCELAGCNNPRGYGVDGARLRYCSDACHALARIGQRRRAA